MSVAVCVSPVTEPISLLTDFGLIALNVTRPLCDT